MMRWWCSPWVIVVSSYLALSIAAEAEAAGNVSHILDHLKVHLQRVHAAIELTNATISAIRNEWQIDKYPNFLKSCFMHKLSWEIMKWKYEQRILTAMITGQPTKFVLSFTGR